ncbi:MAG: nucleotide exchange factor GrpE, partial [Clostridia bacterium]|nr:nucleotide exchange factor GrpE [Clostridia bacterium]
QEFTKMAAAGVIKALLPIIDNLERALTTVEIEKNNFAAGVEMILRQLKEVLAAEGLAPIEAVGQPFNPELHEAVSREETEDQEKINLVLEQYRQGYTLQGKLLRPAMVKVAVAAATEDKQEDIEGGE